MGDKEARRHVCYNLEFLQDIPLGSYRISTEYVYANSVHCSSSDADSDVLADYVLALIRADTPEPELRANAIENLEDFLKERSLSLSVAGAQFLS